MTTIVTILYTHRIALACTHTRTTETTTIRAHMFRFGTHTHTLAPTDTKNQTAPSEHVLHSAANVYVLFGALCIFFVLPAGLTYIMRFCVLCYQQETLYHI